MVQIVDHSQTRCNAFDFAYSTMEKKKEETTLDKEKLNVIY